MVGLLKFLGMLTANTIKTIRALQQKKHRKLSGLFVAEGHRLVCDLLTSPLRLETIYHTNNWQPDRCSSDNRFIEISPKDMSRISGLSTPTPVLAIVHIPAHQIEIKHLDGTLALALDNIQDPGNMGTIIRLADWFGIKHIICSHNTADAFAPKVIQSTMGAIARVSILYTNLAQYLEAAKDAGITIYGTFLDGENIYTQHLNSAGIIVLGNEGNGISNEVEKLVNSRITIPHFCDDENTSESLNVAMATAIVCSEFRSRSIKRS